MKSQPETLLEEVSIGNEQAFEKIYRQHFKSCFDIALYITKSQYLAEETISEVFAEIWKTRTRLKHIDNLEAYLFISVRNKAFLYRSKTLKSKTHYIEDLSYNVSFDKSDNPLEDLQLKELTLKVEKELNKLPEKMKLVFFLVKEKQLSHKEIAKHLNLS